MGRNGGRQASFLFHVNKTTANRFPNGSRSPRHMKLVEQVFHMGLYRALGDSKCAPNFFITLAFRDELQNIQFASAQLRLAQVFRETPN